MDISGGGTLMNTSINALENLENVINQESQNAQQQLKEKMTDRDEIVEKIRQIYQKSYHQLERQIALEIENFNAVKEHYKTVDQNNLDVAARKNYEEEIVLPQIKQKNIKEYENKMSELYVINDNEHLKDNEYYHITVSQFAERLVRAKTVFDCEKNLNVLKDCQRQLQQSDENSWVSEHEEVKKAQALLKEQIRQVGEEFETKIKECLNIDNKGLTIGQLFVENDYLKDWIYQKQLLSQLDHYYQDFYLKIPYQDDFNDYLIISSSIHEVTSALKLLEMNVLMKSIQEPIHVYYDYETLPSLFEEYQYSNCEKVKINHDFVIKLKEEYQQYPNQRISLFIERNQKLDTDIQNFIHEKPDYVQVIICQTEYQDIGSDFISLQFQQDSKNNPYFIVNEKYRLYFNQINEKGMKKLKESEPVSIEKINHFLDEYKQHLHEDNYLIGHNQEISFNDNVVIVSKDEQKRTLFLTQMLLQCLTNSHIRYIYYEDYKDHPLRMLVDEYAFEDIIPDMMEEMMNDYCQDDCLTIFVDPTLEMLGFIETLLDEGHVLMTSEHIIDGYKNLNLDENEIQEFDDHIAAHFEFLNEDECYEIIQEIKQK